MAAQVVDHHRAEIFPGSDDQGLSRLKSVHRMLHAGEGGFAGPAVVGVVAASRDVDDDVVIAARTCRRAPRRTAPHVFPRHAQADDQPYRPDKTIPHGPVSSWPVEIVTLAD